MVASKYKIDCLTVQVTHTSEPKIEELEIYMLFINRAETKWYGYGFLVNKEMKRKIEKNKPVSEGYSTWN